MSALWDALSTVGDVLSMPGDYLRGGLAGRLGERVNARELMSGYGLANPDDDSWLGFGRDLGVGMLTDPLTYAGGALGSLASRGAFKMLGPMYRGGAEKLAGAMATGGPGEKMAGDLLRSPVSKRLLAEIPEGSTFLEGGSNALPFRTPRGDVVRLASAEGGYNAPAFQTRPPLSRVTIPEMLQPTRNVTVGNYRVERVPWAEQVGDRALFAENYGPLTKSIRAQGYHPADMHSGNIGMYQGKPIVIDPGAVVPLGPSPGFPPRLPAPRAPEMLGATPWKMRGPGIALGATAPTLGEMLRERGGYE